MHVTRKAKFVVKKNMPSRICLIAVEELTDPMRRIYIPRYHRQYTHSLEENLSKLSREDVITATLINQNDENSPRWRIDELYKIDEHKEGVKKS